jgi:hypothetical protein
MYHRLMFLPVLLILLSLACSQFPGLAPVAEETQDTAGAIKYTVIPQTISTPELFLPTLPVSVIATPIPTESEPSLQEADPITSGEVTVQDEVIYQLQPGSPVALDNIFRPELGCNWMGVGGQVFGESGQPVGMLIVELGGSLNGKEVTALTLSGSASQWGPGGYEFNLAETPTLSVGSLWVQILSLEGRPLSQRVYFDTSDNCEQVAILINFSHTSTVVVEQLYLPTIHQGQ